MSKIPQLVKSDYLKLAPILGLAFYIAFIPHRNYPYPVHLDEWQHLVHFQALLKAGSITYPDPNLGGTVGLNPNLEVGFHVLWAGFQQISGIPWLVIIRYFPSVIFMMTVLSVYMLTRREGFGWEAALCTCLIPTTVGILGPAFLVPVALGLPFIVITLFVAFNFRGWRSYVVLFMFMSFLLTMHATTAAAIGIILTPYLLLNLKGNFKRSLGIVLALSILFLVFPRIFMLPLTEKSLFSPSFFSPYVNIPRIIQSYSYLSILFCLLGTFVLAMRGEKKSYALILGLLALLIMLDLLFTFHYGILVMYGRWLIDMMLMLGIVAGAGLAWVKNIRLPPGFLALLKAPSITRNVGYVLCLILIVPTLSIAIPARQNTPYYHMIDGEDYEIFMWIKDNIDSSYSKAILDPWKATAFSAITGKYAYSSIGIAPSPNDIKAYGFLQSGSTDTSFLRQNGISIVYAREGSNNPDLTEVRKYVYLLKAP